MNADPCRRPLAAMLFLFLSASTLAAQTRPRARDLGVPFDGMPGPLNAITDVAGVEVGHTTLITGSGPRVVGKGPVRTGVTAILPRGRKDAQPVFAAWHSLNGNGEMTGTAWVEESGQLEGPVLITNTHSVGVVRDATIEWQLRQQQDLLWALPVVAETWDGILNDLNGFHVRPEHVFAALDGTSGGAVPEGGVGGGTGMVCNGFKGGIGTSSRRVSAEAGGYTLGVLVQCNYGRQAGLRIAGVPVGAEITEPGMCLASSRPPSLSFLRSLGRCDGTEVGQAGGEALPELGSIIIVIATNAPLLPHQLARIARRATLGLGREGSIAGNGSGDIFIAFSTANTGLSTASGTVALSMLPNDRIDALFAATVQATEEAITNAMIAAETMTGADDVRVRALPHDQLRAALAKYNRLP